MSRKNQFGLAVVVVAMCVLALSSLACSSGDAGNAAITASEKGIANGQAKSAGYPSSISATAHGYCPDGYTVGVVGHVNSDVKVCYKNQ